MYGACALNIHDTKLDQDLPLPRLALGGGFAGDPPSRSGPAQILPFPIDRVLRDRDGAGNGEPQDGADARPAEGEGLHPMLDPAYWDQWMRAILGQRPVVAIEG